MMNKKDTVEDGFGKRQGGSLMWLKKEDEQVVPKASGGAPTSTAA